MNRKPEAILPPRDVRPKTGRPPRAWRPPNAFSAWMDEVGKNIHDVARELGISESYAYGLRNGSSTPGRALSWKIAEYTGGKVSGPSWDD